MENFNVRTAVDPIIILLVDSVLIINYAVSSITVINKGELAGTINGIAIDPTEINTMADSNGGYYKPNKFTIDATGTTFKLLINKI
jgi:hypothetical protein